MNGNCKKDTKAPDAMRRLLRFAREQLHGAREEAEIAGTPLSHDEEMDFVRDTINSSPLFRRLSDADLDGIVADVIGEGEVTR